jgi:hypothetical protein
MFEPAHAGCYGFYVASGVSRIIMFFDWREGIQQSGTGMDLECWCGPLVSECLSRLTPAATVFSWERMDFARRDWRELGVLEVGSALRFRDV